MIDLIPDEWKVLLDEIQVVCPSAVIAGGALRDTYFGKDVKDIDIFIEAGDLAEAEGLFEKLGGPKAVATNMLGGLTLSDAGIYPETMNEVVMVVDYPKKVGNIPVQLIFINWKTRAILDRFDIGLCQISYDGFEVKMHENFKKAEQDKVINIIRCRNKFALGASINRYVRMLKKYPDFDLQLDLEISFPEEGLT